MQTYSIPGVNNLDNMGRWAFVEFTRMFEIEAEFKDLVDSLTQVRQQAGEKIGNV